MDLNSLLTNLAPLIFFLLTLLPIIAALYCLYLSYRYIKASWILQDTPLTKIRSAAQGYVELYARVETIHPDRLSKLKKIPCAWYSYIIEMQKEVQDDQGSHMEWVLIEEGKSNSPFLINDGTGVCLIFPERAVILCQHYDRFVDSQYPQTDNTSATEKKGQSVMDLLWKIFFPKPKVLYRYSESRLEPSDNVYATGIFNTVSIEDPHIQQNENIISFLKNQGMRNINLLTDENLPEKHEFVVSSIKEIDLTKRYRRNALIYFLAFLFFCAASTSSIYTIVNKSLFNNE